MLVLSRQRDQTIVIGDQIRVTVVDIRGDKVRLGIRAPEDVAVHRQEIYDAIQRENRAAAAMQPMDLAGTAGIRPARHRPTRTLHGRAPARIDLAGGGTDLSPYRDEHHGLAVTAAISRYVYATLVPRDDREIHLHAADLDQHVVIPSIRALELDGELDLMKACIRRVGPTRGFELTVYSEIPAAAGLAEDAALAVLVCALCTQYEFGGFDPAAMAQMAGTVEREDLNRAAGRQEHFATVDGGLQFLQFVEQEVRREPANLADETLRQLEKNLLLVHTGRSEQSADVRRAIQAACTAGDRTVLEGLHGLKAVARQLQTALREGDLEEFAALLSENQRYQQMLHPAFGTPELGRFLEAGIADGALGGHVCGPDGGCIVFYARDNARPQLARTLQELGGQVLPFSFDTQGTIVW